MLWNSCNVRIQRLFVASDRIGYALMNVERGEGVIIYTGTGDNSGLPICLRLL